MANERRLRVNDQLGIITDNPLATTTTVINSAGFATLPVVDGTTHLAITLNPDLSAVPSTNAEVVWVTAHSSGATIATVVRGREGTTASGYNVSTTWVHGPTIADHAPTLVDTSGSLPSTGGLPFDMQIAAEADTKKLKVYNASTSAWMEVFNGGAAWTSWTPTITGNGWALGNGTATGHYKKQGRTLRARGEIILGSSSTKGSASPTIGGLPATNTSTLTFTQGHASFQHNADGSTYGGAWIVNASATSGKVYVLTTFGSTPALFGNIDSNTPFNWATLDIIYFDIELETSA